MGEPGVDTAAAPADPLERYRRTTRRRNRIYYAVLAAILAVIGIVVGLAWSAGEIAHTSLHTVPSAPSSLGIAAPSPTQQPAWRSADHVALGRPQWGGTVVTYSAHTVGGLDARTGAQTWSYTRTDRSVCTAAQLGGTTIAVYALNGNCDEVTALDSATGARQWTRTLDMDGMPVNGHPQYQLTNYTFLAYTPDVVYAIDPVSGENRFTYQRYGCRIEHVVLGSAGALISQDCGAKMAACAGAKFCGRGPQLLLRDGSAARGDSSKPNPDQIKWLRLGDTDVPVSADQVISSVDSSGRTLSALDASSGRPTATVPLHPRSAGLGAVTAAPTSTDELAWLGGTLYALRTDGSVDWSAAAAAPPTVYPTSDIDPPTPATARISVVAGGGVELLNGTTGRVVARYALSAPAGAVAYPLGTGFLVASRNGIAAYR